LVAHSLASPDSGLFQLAADEFQVGQRFGRFGQQAGEDGPVKALAFGSRFLIRLFDVGRAPAFIFLVIFF
jgi:hypothetical protein